MNVDDARAEFEALFATVVADDIQTTASHAPNGRLYDKMFAVKDDAPSSRNVPMPFPSADAACQAWLALARSKLKPADTALFWRIYPHVIEINGGVTVMSAHTFGTAA